MSYERVVISLVDTYAYIRDTFREVATSALLRHTERRPSRFATVLFDPQPFLAKLVEDINLGDNRPRRLGGGSDQTIQMLVDAGMPGDTARWMYHQCWNQITDQVAACLPEATTGSDSPWEYELSMGMDLLVSRWLDSPEVGAAALAEPVRADHTIMGDILGQSGPAIAVPGTRLSADHSWLLEESTDHLPQITSAQIDAQFRREYGRGT